MTTELKTGVMTIQRADILASLRALLVTQDKFSAMLKEDAYIAGYREGFEDALKVMALIVGAGEAIGNARII